MAKTTPTVRNKTLNVAQGKRLKLTDQQAWLDWLEAEETAVFRYEGHAGSFTARRERRQRGGYYWTAYRRHMNRLHKVYLGRSDTLTPDALEAPAVALQGRIEASQQTGAPVRPSVMEA
jgi:LuxR family transcriptional regulator, maltose regulon positive regulatory protein